MDDSLHVLFYISLQKNIFFLTFDRKMISNGNFKLSGIIFLAPKM